MSDIIDINVGQTVEEVTINVVDNVIQVNINKITGGGGGSQTLAETLALGNVTGGENISISNGDAIVLDNGSRLKKGTTDAGNGGNKGIALKCSLDYELKWEAGRQYIMEQDGITIREVSHNFTNVPTANDDDTKGFVANSRWILDNGDVYVCTDATTDNAVWELVNTIPTLQEVTDEGNETTNSIIVESWKSKNNNNILGVYEELDTNKIATLKTQAGITNLSEWEIKPYSGVFAFESDIPDTSGLVPYQLGGGLYKSINLFDEVGNVGSLKLPDNLTQDRLLLFQDKDYTGIADITDIPDVSTLVPYSGANQNVDLGEFELKAGQLTLDTTPTGTAAVTTTRWNDSVGVSETTLKGGNVILKNGVDLVARVVNKVNPNTTLTKAAYQVVKVSGAQGQRLAVELAQANNDNNSADTLGIVIETIAANQEGFIMTVGQLEGINTTGSLQGETWSDGDVLYLSPTTAGRITNIKPTGATGHIVVLGYVEHAHITQGKIYVKIMNGWELDELHNVSITTPLNNQVLTYESSTDLWKNKSLGTILGYTPYRNLQTSQTIHTGTTAETVLFTATIPAGAFSSNDVIKLLFGANKTTALGTYSLRIRVNTTNTISGAPTIALYSGTATAQTNIMMRNFSLNGGNLYGIGGGNSAITDIVALGGSLGSNTLNPSNQFFLFATITLNNSGDSIIGNMLSIHN